MLLEYSWVFSHVSPFQETICWKWAWNCKKMVSQMGIFENSSWGGKTGRCWVRCGTRWHTRLCRHSSEHTEECCACFAKPGSQFANTVPLKVGSGFRLSSEWNAARGNWYAMHILMYFSWETRLPAVLTSTRCTLTGKHFPFVYPYGTLKTKGERF